MNFFSKMFEMITYAFYTSNPCLTINGAVAMWTDLMIFFSLEFFLEYYLLVNLKKHFKFHASLLFSSEK